MGYCGTPGCQLSNCDPRTPPGSNMPRWLYPKNSNPYLEYQTSLQKMYEKYENEDKSTEESKE